MECYIHPDQSAVGACVACGHFVCDVCRVSMNGKLYCKACVERGEANPPPPDDHWSPDDSHRGASGSLSRSRTDKIIAGVCGGLAKQFNLDPNLVRALSAVATVFTGIFPGAVVYAILWAVLPEEE